MTDTITSIFVCLWITAIIGVFAYTIYRMTSDE